MKFSEEFCKIKFTGQSQKEAYLSACKWYATNIIAKDEMHNVLVSFEKDEHLPTVTLHLFAALDQKQLKEKHCSICKESHKAFYINESYNCSSCKAEALQNRMKQMIEVSKSYYRELLEKLKIDYEGE